MGISDMRGRLRCSCKVVGVLTKPDAVPEGEIKSRQMWLDVLEGRRLPLKHGYFCTLQPDEASRNAGVMPAEARDAEAKFFATKAPWARSTAAARGRLGTPNLVKRTSELLHGLIRDSYVAMYVLLETLTQYLLDFRAS